MAHKNLERLPALRTLLLIVLLPLAASAQVVPKVNAGRIANGQIGLGAECFLSPSISLTGSAYKIIPRMMDARMGIQGGGGGLEMRKYNRSKLHLNRREFYFESTCDKSAIADNRPQGFYLSLGAEMGRTRFVVHNPEIVPTEVDEMGQAIAYQDITWRKPDAFQFDISGKVGYQFRVLRNGVVDLGFGPTVRTQREYLTGLCGFGIVGSREPILVYYTYVVPSASVQFGYTLWNGK